MINGTERWCQGFSEPGAGSDLASLTTTATREGDEYVINGHKIWTSYSDVADWCLLLARTDKDVPNAQGHLGVHRLDAPAGDRAAPAEDDQRRHQGIRPGALRRRPGARRVRWSGAPGDGWTLAMTVVGHEREPSTLGILGPLREDRAPVGIPRRRCGHRDELAWAAVQTEMLRQHVRRRLSEQLDGISHGPQGSIDKLLMTWVEQSVGHAALATVGTSDAELFGAYLYSRAQSVMGGTSQIQKNIIASRILGLASSERHVRHAKGNRRPGRRRRCASSR